MDRLRRLFAEANAAYSRLQPRERKLVTVGGLFALVAITLLVSFAVSSAVTRRETRIDLKITQLEEFRRSMGGFRAAEQERSTLETRLKGAPVRLFSLLEDAAKRHGLEIGGMVDKGIHPLGESKINEISVEVTLNRIPLDKLVQFLTELESGQALVKVTRIQIRPRPGDATIDASLMVSTYQLQA